MGLQGLHDLYGDYWRPVEQYWVLFTKERLRRHPTFWCFNRRTFLEHPKRFSLDLACRLVSSSLQLRRALTPQSSRFAYRCHRRLCAKAVPKVQVNPELDPYETGHSTGRPCVLSSTKRIPSAGKDVAIESSSFTIWC
ncbi:hypothetical protein PC121_g12448 [Phytophthora cactorum]|nr:hypothetical protein PC121_g12448 [Phytophthora cactorum]